MGRGGGSQLYMSGLEIWYVSWDLELLAFKGFGDLEGFGSYMHFVGFEGIWGWDLRDLS